MIRLALEPRRRPLREVAFGYTDPPTFVAGAVLPAATLNTNLRDNLRSLVDAGGDLVAANSIAITHGFHKVTGNTGVAEITRVSGPKEVWLWFTGTPTITHTAGGGAANSLVLLGGANYAVTANEILVFRYDGSQWREVVRKAAAQVFALVANSTLGAPAANFDVQNIAATYAALKLVAAGRGDAAGTFQQFVVRFNNDATAIYDHGKVLFAGAAAAGVATAADTGMNLGEWPDSSATAAKQGQADVTIMHYAGTVFHKVATATWNDIYNETVGNFRGGAAAGTWRNTAAINRITTLLSSGNMITGSRQTLYGLGV